MRFSAAQWAVLLLAVLVAVAYVAGLGPFHRCSETGQLIQELETSQQAQNHPSGWVARCRD